jgi:hypothetical protein
MYIILTNTQKVNGTQNKQNQTAHIIMIVKQQYKQNTEIKVPYCGNIA